MHNSKSVLVQRSWYALYDIAHYSCTIPYRTLGSQHKRAEISKKSMASSKNQLVPYRFPRICAPHPSSAAWLQPVSGSASTKQPNSNPSPPANLTKSKPSRNQPPGSSNLLSPSPPSSAPPQSSLTVHSHGTWSRPTNPSRQPLHFTRTHFKPCRQIQQTSLSRRNQPTNT